MNHPLNTIKPYFLKYISYYLFGGFFLALTNIINLVQPWILKHAIDSIKSISLNHNSLKGGVGNLLVKFALIILGVALIQAVFRYLWRKLIMSTARKIEYEIRRDYFHHLQTLSFSYFNKAKTGELMARATNDMEAVRMLLGPGIMASFDTILLTSLSLVMMLVIDVKLTLLSLSILPIIAISSKELGNIVHKEYRKVQDQFAVLTTKVQENLSGIRVIKAYTQELYEIEDFKKLGRDYVKKNLDLAKVSGIFYPLLTIIMGLSTAIIIYFGGSEVVSGNITLGDFVAFNAYLNLLVWPMIAIGWVVNLFQRGLASIKRINEVMLTEPDIKDEMTNIEYQISDIEYRISNENPQSAIRNPQSAIRNTIRGEIEFKNVSFSYNGQPVLKNINLKIEQGKTVAIMGHTGSGKSTLVNLIPRLFDVKEGQLLIDGVDIKQIPLYILRKNIGYVPQDSFLFSDTIRNNIGYGVENPSDDEIIESANISQITKDVQDFPNGFDTIIGERGITLSGGQKQRVSIARAIIRKPAILILDDAFSSVDTHTEEEILRKLKEIMKERTSIIISHRVSTVKDSDMIVVLQDGEIVEKGNHQELLNNGGVYANLYRMQLLEKEIEDFKCENI